MSQKDSLIERLTDYYLSRREYAFAPVPKSMDLMEGQYFSRTFRREYPEFNGLIWAYHWLQVGLYEPFLQPGPPAETKAGVQATVARFWSMLENPPARMPRMMPMTPAIAPRFSERHPRAAAIFDNLHMMHDIISDILVADTVPYREKRRVIYAQLDRLQDSTNEVLSWDEWRDMAETMGGVAVMGGPATGLAARVQAPVTPAPDMAGMQHGARQHGRGASPRPRPGAGAPAAADSAHAGRMMELHRRMMADSAIRRRVMADTALRRLMREMMTTMPPEHRAHMRGMMEGERPRPPRPEPEAPPPAPADSAAGHRHDE
jgi:hypothetical protein